MFLCFIHQFCSLFQGRIADDRSGKKAEKKPVRTYQRQRRKSAPKTELFPEAPQRSARRRRNSESDSLLCPPSAEARSLVFNPSCASTPISGSKKRRSQMNQTRVPSPIQETAEEEEVPVAGCSTAAGSSHSMQSDQQSKSKALSRYSTSGARRPAKKKTKKEEQAKQFEEWADSMNKYFAEVDDFELDVE